MALWICVLGYNKPWVEWFEEHLFPKCGKHKHELASLVGLNIYLRFVHSIVSDNVKPTLESVGHLSNPY
jgi:hypothetical protein